MDRMMIFRIITETEMGVDSMAHIYVLQSCTEKSMSKGSSVMQNITISHQSQFTQEDINIWDTNYKSFISQINY